MRSFLLVLALLAAAAAAQAQPPAAAVSDCTLEVGGDQDEDGFTDACELAIARTFAPLLAVRSGGCNWDATSSPQRLGGGYRFAVHPTDYGAVAVYLPAYFRDCGWTGAKCWLPWVDCAPHAGDSELIALELVRGEGQWVVGGVFLSAHCFGRSSGHCRWYRDEDLADFHFDDTMATIWVSEGRQANYPNRRACDRGHHGLDTCDRHDASYIFPITGAHQNIGSATRPSPPTGCITGHELGNPAVVPNAVECFWAPGQTFRGWQAEVKGATGYWRYLALVLQLADVPAGQ